MQSPNEKELEHYRKVAEIIYENKPKEKERLNTGAKMTLAEIKLNLPRIDDDTARTFLVSIAYMVAGLSGMPVRDLVNTLESIFDHHMLAVASMLGLVNLDEGEDSGPTVDELIARREAREAEYREAMNRFTSDEMPGNYM